MDPRQDKSDQSETTHRSSGQDIPLVRFRQDTELRYRWISDPVRLFENLSVLGKRDDELLPSSEAAVLTGVKRKALQTGRTTRQIVHLTPDETTYWIDVVVKPVIGNNEEVIGLSGAYWDLAECIKAVEDKNWPTVIASDQNDRLLYRHGGYAAIRTNERGRLARDLHDFLGPNLTTLNLNLNSLKIQSAKSLTDQGISSTLDAILLLADDLSDIIQSLITDLRSPHLAEFGLVSSLITYRSDFTKRTGIDIVLEAESFPKLSLHLEEAIFRIIQEALNNSAKHADAQRIVIQLQRDSGLIRVSITDDGCGFDLHQHRQTSDRRGWGLIFMEERALAFGGDFRVESAQGGGTQIIVEIPK